MDRHQNFFPLHAAFLVLERRRLPPLITDRPSPVATPPLSITAASHRHHRAPSSQHLSHYVYPSPSSPLPTHSSISTKLPCHHWAPTAVLPGPRPLLCTITLILPTTIGTSPNLYRPSFLSCLPPIHTACYQFSSPPLFTTLLAAILLPLLAQDARSIISTARSCSPSVTIPPPLVSSRYHCLRPLPTGPRAAAPSHNHRLLPMPPCHATFIFHNSR